VNYTLRRGPLAPVVTWRLTDDALIEQRGGKPERRLPLADLKSARVAPGANRYVPGERVLRLSFPKTSIAISSHGFEGLALYRDQGAVFGAFVRAVLVQAAAKAPGAQYEVGAARGAGMLAGAAAILAAGVLIVLVAAIVGRQWALGLELSARLGFVLLLMIAVAPWLRRERRHSFDPASPPADLLA